MIVIATIKVREAEYAKFSNFMLNVYRHRIMMGCLSVCTLISIKSISLTKRLA
jgi:hypothetical protein